MNTVQGYINSAKEMKKVRTIAVCALLGAIAIVLGYFTIPVGNVLKIGFSSLANETASLFFGPVVGGIFGGAMDIVKYLMKPTGGYFPGFTFSAMLAGVINGMMFYRRPISLKRIIIAKFLVAVICNILLNTLWVSIITGTSFFVYLPVRVMTNMIMWVIGSLLMYIVFTAISKAGILQSLHKDGESV